MDIIQLLPLNDTGRDTSPYNAISAYALNPIHLHLDSVEASNGAQRVDYDRVRQAKEKALRHAFDSEFAKLRASSDYEEFIKRHGWLDGYALFKTLKEEQGWTSWRAWSAPLSSPSPGEIMTLKRHYQAEMDYHRFVQYLCFSQFEGVKRYANQQGVRIKGDIPIACGEESADAWFHPEMFVPGLAAGSPPDMYNWDGQNWGFPVYDWEVIAKDNYRWWKERLAVAERLYDIYRIDHIVGIFRIWTIKSGQEGATGDFLPADPDTWIAHGERILRMMLANSSMLPIGEDLGTVPPEVRICLRELGICGTKVMRWERRWEEDKSFIPLKEYPLASMTTVSTHDSETLEQWWQNAPDEAKLYAETKHWNYTVPLPQQCRYEILRESHRTHSLFHINLLNEYLALLPNLVWPDPSQERINVPGTIADTNWTYRFRPSVEEIISNPDLKQLMLSLLPKP